MLVDLPGFQRPLDALTERMQRTVDHAFEDVDAVLFVVSARRIGGGDRFIARKVFGLGVPVVIALNKVDNIVPGHIASQMQAAARLGDFHALHPVSAKTGDGIGELRDELVGLLPEGPAYFAPDQRTDLTVEAQVAELVREKALQADARRAAARDLGRRRGAGRKGGAGAHLCRDRVAETDRRGPPGAIVKEIGVRARPEIEQLLGHPVFSTYRSRCGRNGAAMNTLRRTRYLGLAHERRGQLREPRRAFRRRKCAFRRVGPWPGTLVPDAVDRSDDHERQELIARVDEPERAPAMPK